MSDTNITLGTSDPSLRKTPDQNESKSSSGNPSTNTFMGATLRGWAISAISAVAVLTAAGTGIATVYSKIQSLNTEVHNRTEENNALTKQNVNLTSTVNTVASLTQAKLTEAEKHEQNKDKFESIPIENGSDGSEIVRADYYPVDGCVHLSRKTNSQGVSGSSQDPDVYYGNDQDVWIIDPLRAVVAQSTHSSDSHGTAVQSNVSDVAGNEAPSIAKKRPSRYEQTLSQRIHSPNARLVRVGMFQPNCITPHPGKFTVRNVQQGACNVQVWRTFNDGCVHYQMYNACNGQWDPKINWTACVAQHHS
jgi:hypothetical protein